MQSNRAGIGIFVLFLGTAIASGCGGGGKVTPGTDGGPGKGDSAVDAPDAPVGPDGGKPVNSCLEMIGRASTDLGQPCACDSDCGSNFCVDGVCCNSGCTARCMACDLPGSEGTCGVIPEGVQPRDQSECPLSPASSCGQDGTCDGQGGCRSHVLGTVCFGGMCDGDGMSGINICDGQGACRPGPAASCFPYSCAAGACLSKCAADKDCSAGRTCVGNSCGKLPTGRGPCTSDDECTSGHCADGVCCNVGCSGACVSCNQTGFVGQCRPVGAGLPHPMCVAQPRSTCGTTGVCDGFGSCALYPAETTCLSPKCAGNMANTAGTCDGEGTCRPPGQIDCAPFICSGEGCVKTCTADAQCVPPATCVGGSCGKKPMGSPCTGAAQCDSGQCVDGVCCDSPCTGACQSCALQSSLGQCRNVARGAIDPHGQCKDLGAASCGTDGKCDGSGACRVYAVATVCGPETCVGGAYTPPRTCNATGQCIPPDSQTCAPFACNGTKCFDVCTTNAQCVGTNSCVLGSCGLKPLGANCSAASECQAGADGQKYCSQGVCCNNACTTTCQACNLAGSLGTCSTVANDTIDPQKRCVTTAVGTCGTNGRCRGGVCDTYRTTDRCRPAACSGTSASLGAAFCDGRGSACPVPSTVACGVYVCDAATGSCKSSCTTNADCVSPNTCNGGSCGKKSNGASCSGAGQCLSGNCTEGVCCNTPCTDATTGTCRSCKVAGNVGTCLPVPVGGADPKARCLATAQSSCGLNGTCDGAGSCDFWGTNIGCRAQSCTGSTQTNTATCNGNGACPVATTKACDPYTCNTAAATCRTTCTASTDCNAGIACNTQTNKCGDKLPNGRVCAVAGDCSSAFCVKALPTDTTGICCNAPCAGGCETCSLTGKVGTCSPIAAGGVPRVATMCSTSPTTTCGNTGRCDGTGACQIAGGGAVCNDGNPCTTNDVCTAGACMGTPKVCTASDQCHTAGVCDMTTGACTNPAKAAGTVCDDNNGCTTGETCTAAGACAGGTARVCVASDQCHNAGTCNPSTGMCSNPAKAAGAACSSNNGCITGETCNAAGVCGGGTPRVCTASDQCHNAGTCDPTTGVCSNPAKAAGAACNDGNGCTTGETCSAGGVCGGGSARVCAASDQCHDVGVCNAATGACSNPAKPAGSPCNDDNACTTGEACNAAGACGGGSAKACPAADACHLAGVCNRETGVCSNPVRTGTCDDGDGCTRGETCSAAGVCAGGTPVTCPATDDCHGPGTCSAGLCAGYPVLPDGTVCGPGGSSNRMCCGGVCSRVDACPAVLMSI